MSKFVDRLQGVSKASSAPLGFHTGGGKASQSSLLLIGGLSGTDTGEARILADSGVDAGLVLAQGSGLKMVEEMVGAMDGVPLGVLLGAGDGGKMAGLAKAGCDFVVFDVKMPIAALQEKNMGRFLKVEAALDYSLIRAISELDVDGLVVSVDGEKAITFEQLLTYRRLVGLAGKPLVLSLSALTTDGELAGLWKAGIDGIVIPPSQPASVLADLKTMVQRLPKRAERQRARPEVVLPRHSRDIGVEEEEEDEEEDEDEVV